MYSVVDQFLTAAAKRRRQEWLAVYTRHRVSSITSGETDEALQQLVNTFEAISGSVMSTLSVDILAASIRLTAFVMFMCLAVIIMTIRYHITGTCSLRSKESCKVLSSNLT